MGSGGSKPKDKKDGEDDADSKCVISANMMKLITLITLLVSDFDIVFTVMSLISYYQASGVFILFIALIGLFFMVYVGGCVIAAKESGKFMDRFKDKVRLNEINGISMEDLEDALGARRIFWMGSDFEAAKKRKLSVDALKAATPDASEPHEIDIPALEMALREAEMAGTSSLRAAGDPKFGAKAVKRANDKLRAAKKAQANQPSLAKKISQRNQALGGPNIGDVPDDIPDAHYDANKPKTRDQMEGRGGDSNKVDMGELPDDDDPEGDAMKKMFETEEKEAQEKGDTNLVRMLQLASLKQLDSYKVDHKLLDKKGKISDPLRALFMICEAKGILHSYHQASRAFSRRIVKPSHSIPYYRLMEFGWQPSVSHTDFAGILNANGLYSFTVGFPQLFFSIAFTMSPKGARVPAPCELDASTLCSLAADFQKPIVQNVIVTVSLAIGIISLFISLLNIVVDFPAQLFDIAEKEEEALAFTLQAELATRTWEDKLQVEVQENVKMMLKMSTQFENNSIPGMEAPGLVIDDVMKLERRAMEKKVAYIEHFLTMSEDEKKIRNDLRDGKRKKKKGDEDPEADFAAEEAVSEPLPAPPTPQPLPPPPGGIIKQPTQPAVPPPEPQAVEPAEPAEPPPP